MIDLAFFKRKITKEDVDKYFEENMCVSFDKFIENWNEQEELTDYYKKENEKLTNIINELERKLLSTYSTYVSMDKVPEIAKYIRELKGSESNE